MDKINWSAAGNTASWVYDPGLTLTRPLRWWRYWAWPWWLLRRAGRWLATASGRGPTHGAQAMTASQPTPDLVKRLKKAGDHTPGPWTVIASPHGRKYRCVQLGKDDTYTTLEMLPADARLIALAPEMAEAIISLSTRLAAMEAERDGLLAFK